MSYRIRYTSVGPDMPKTFGKRKWITLSIFVLAIGVVASNLYLYPWLEKILLPAGSSVLESLEVAVAQLKDGGTFSDAVTAFCRDVIFHAG